MKLKLQYAQVLEVSLRVRLSGFAGDQNLISHTGRAWSTFLTPVDPSCVGKFLWANTKAATGETALEESSSSL